LFSETSRYRALEYVHNPDRPVAGVRDGMDERRRHIAGIAGRMVERAGIVHGVEHRHARLAADIKTRPWLRRVAISTPHAV
jgi:hypothetical protein